MRTRERETSSRASGDLLFYFITHNVISVIFFFLLTVRFEVYMGKEQLIGFIFQKEFWELTIFQVFPISVISSLIGRITAFYIMKGYHKYHKKRATKRWSELNKGINRMGIQFIITTLITSLIFSLGLVSILQFTVFNEETLLTLIIIYIGIKIGTYFFVRWLVRAKL